MLSLALIYAVLNGDVHDDEAAYKHVREICLLLSCRTQSSPCRYVHCEEPVTNACSTLQVDQAVVEIAGRVRLHSDRSQADEWARESDDSEVRGISEERISEVTFLTGRVSEARHQCLLLLSLEYMS